MKKILLIAAMALMSSSAFASKARTGALQNTVTANADISWAQFRPSLLPWIPDQALLEFGPTRADGTGAVNAQGGFIRTMGDAKLSLYLGRQPGENLVSLMGLYLNDATVGADLSYMENPMTLSYASKSGDMQWGAALYYASSEKKHGTAATGTSASNKKSSTSLALSVDSPEFWAIVNFGLGTKSLHTATADKSGYKGKGDMFIGAGMWMEKFAPYFGYGSQTNEIVTAGDTVASDNDANFILLGVEAQTRGDGQFFYYGTNYTTFNMKDKTADVKVAASHLDVYFGMEADAASWLVLRGSLVQSLLIDTNKVDAGSTTVTDTNNNGNPSLAAGAGFKFNKFMLDWTMTAAATGSLTTAGFGSNASLTYFF